MATYKEIFGTNIEVLASDPSNPVEGQVWYNSTDNVVKGAAATTVGSWATGGSLNQARAQTGAAGSDSTNAIAMGGDVPPETSNTELYNGSAWTEVNNMNAATRLSVGVGADN